MSKRRSALVVPRFPLPLPTPPGEDYFAEPGRLMRREGFEVEVLTTRQPEQPETETIEGFTVRRFDSTLRWLGAIRSGGYDLVHAHSQLRPSLLTGATAGRAKSVLTSHTFVLPLAAWKRRLMIALMNRFDRVIAFTDYERQVFVQSGVSPSRVAVVPLAINVAFFRSGGDPSRFRRQWSLSASWPLLLFVANIQTRKNPRVLLRAFTQVRQKVPEVRLVVIGKDLLPEQGQPSFDQMARECGVANEVTRTGWLAAEPLRDALAAATVVINSSGYRSFENFPLSIMEAASASRPLCLPTLGSLQSVFGQDALYHEPEDDAQLVANILRYLEDPALREERGRACRARVEDFDVPRAHEQLLGLYRTVLGR
jgi:glycosyltransferase involved in cell wall biosynthesis